MAFVVLLGSVPVSLPLSAQTSTAALSDLNDQGTFEIFSAGKNIGSETFAIHVEGDRIVATGDGHLQIDQNGRHVEVQTSSKLLLDTDFEPISYTWSQEGQQSSNLSIDFRSKVAHVQYKQVNGQEDKRDFKLDKDVIVLDDNVVHQYELALARYDTARGGMQVLRGFIPQEALPGVITLKFVGPEAATVDGDKMTLRHFALTAELAQINLWADDRGHLQVLSSIDQQFQAVRKKETGK
jgi:hypothetical protein